MIQITSSPLQMKQLTFTKVYIEANPDLYKEDDPLKAPEYDLEGVNIGHKFRSECLDTDSKEPQLYYLELCLALPNKKGIGTPSPYFIDLCAHAVFEIDESCPLELRKSIVDVNGASMILGAMREVITQNTARSVYGPLTLPTLRFLPEDNQTEEKKSKSQVTTKKNK